MTKARNLFGEEISREGVIKITLSGNSFDSGEIHIKDLYTELQSVEKVIRYNIKLLIETGKLDSSHKDLEIYVHIQDGSIAEAFKVIFAKENLAPAAVTLVVGLLNATYSHFLDSSPTSSTETNFPAELATIQNDPSIKKELSNLITPVNSEGKSITIEDNHGTINLNISYDDKQKIVQNLSTSDIDDPLKKNGEFEETLTGVIRKIDLDATRGNYLGFNIDSGPTRIPTSIRGQFDLNDYRDLIDKHIRVQALVNYKNDAIIHIIVKDYKIVNSQTTLEMP